MKRVPAVQASGAIVEAIKVRRGGHLTPLDEVLLHSPAFAAGWNTLLGAVRSEMELPAVLRELAICRIAALNEADYEWRAHAPLARSHGLSEVELSALRKDADPAPLNPLHSLVRDYTDAMTENISVPDSLSDDLRQRLGDRQLVELTGTVAAYNMVSRFLVALHIGDDRRPTDGTR